MQNSNDLSINENIILTKKDEMSFRMPYHKPILEELGDLRALTLGGTPGCFDSTVPGTGYPGDPDWC